MPIKKVDYKHEFVMLETSGLQLKFVSFSVKSKVIKLFTYVFLKEFYIYGSYDECLFHFEFIFMYDVRQGSNFIF